VISDLDIACYLHTATNKDEQKARQAQPLVDAINYGLTLHDAKTISANESVGMALEIFAGDNTPPLLIVVGAKNADILGIVTPFDLL
jgi:hypothetical protein